MLLDISLGCLALCSLLGCLALSDLGVGGPVETATQAGQGTQIMLIPQTWNTRTATCGEVFFFNAFALRNLCSLLGSEHKEASSRRLKSDLFVVLFSLCLHHWPLALFGPVWAVQVSASASELLKEARFAFPGLLRFVVCISFCRFAAAHSCSLHTSPAPRESFSAFHHSSDSQLIHLLH